eukprot:scaffold5708_cov107-Isochrysis_galbana.AAC.8
MTKPGLDGFMMSATCKKDWTRAMKKSKRVRCLKPVAPISSLSGPSSGSSSWGSNSPGISPEARSELTHSMMASSRNWWSSRSKHSGVPWTPARGRKTFISERKDLSE